jgi:hypothetical protein
MRITVAGKIIKLLVTSLFKTEYKQVRSGSWHTKAVETFHKDLLEAENTYISIFGAGQQEQLEKLQCNEEINILFKSSKAYNRNMGYYLGPRNTVVVYELK